MSESKVQLSEFDLNLLVALHSLLETTSVTRAAAETGVSQSAMSHTLRRLRAVFGDQLLVRAGSSMRLTPRAEAMREPLYESLLAVQKTLRASQTFVPGESTRELSIGATDFIQLVFLPDLTRLVGREAGNLRLRVKSTVLNGSYGRDLETGELDLVVGGGLLGDYPGLKRTLLVREALVCATRSDHPRVRDADTLSLDVYLAMPHLLISPSGRGPAIVDRLLAADGKRRHVAMRISSFLMAPWVLAASDYVLTAPERVISLHRDFLGLRVWRPPVEIAEVPVYIFWHERSDHDPAVTWLRKAILRACREMPTPVGENRP